MNNIGVQPLTGVALIVVFCSIMFMSKGICQQKDTTFAATNTFYADFATKGAFYSLNYDRIFLQRKKITYSYRLGFSILEDAIAFPLGINLFTGKENSHAEFSLTIIPYIDHYKSFLSKNDLSDKYIYVVPGIGYKFQKPKGGFFLKAVISPMIFLDPPSRNFRNMAPKLYIAGNMSIGLSF